MKTKQKSIGFTEQENSLIETVAESTGLSYSGFIRNSAIEKARQLILKLNLGEIKQES